MSVYRRATIGLGLFAFVGCREPSVVVDARPASAAAATTERRTEGTTCNEVALRRAAAVIADEWSRWSASAGTIPDASHDAFSAIWTSCPTLPESGRVALDDAAHYSPPPTAADAAVVRGEPLPGGLDDPLAELLPGHRQVHDLGEASERAAMEWRASGCADFPRVAQAMSEAPASEREGILWDACFADKPLVPREDFVVGPRGNATLALALHRWLTENAHVDVATADTLARALILDGHWLVDPPEGLRLPTAAAGQRVEDGIALEVGAGGIVRSSQHLAKLDAQLGVETTRPDKRGEPIVGPVFDVLSEEFGEHEQLAARTGGTVPMLLLVADRDIPWSTLRPLVASALRAHLERVALVGLTDNPADPVRMVVIHDSRARRPPLGIAPTTTAQALADRVLAEGEPTRLLR